MSKWQTKTLAEVLVKTAAANPADAPEDEFDYIDVSSVSNLTYTVETTQRLLGKDAPSRARKLVRTGDVLFATIRPTLKRIAVVPSALNGQVCSTGYFLLRATSEIDQKFLFYSLFKPAFMEAMDALQKGASYPAVTDAEVRAQPICYPSVPEQRRIVAILDEAFEGIATAKANAEKNLQNARELIGNGYQSITDASGRLNWSISPVTEIAASRKGSMRTGPFGSQLLHSEFVEDGVAVLGIDNAVANEFRWDRRRYISEEKYSELSRYRVFPGDVLITIMGTCGRCAVVPEDIPLAINSKHLCCISLDPAKCSPEYLHAYFLYDHTARKYLTAQAKGSIMAGLNMGIISELPVRLPSLEQQRTIVSKFDQLQAECDRLIEIQARKLTALTELKKSLLHQAFSGRL